MSPWPAVAVAISVWPSCAVPVITGTLTVGAASTTTVVGALAAEPPVESVTTTRSRFVSSVSPTR